MAMTHHKNAVGEEEHDEACIGERAFDNSRYWDRDDVAVSPGARTIAFQRYCCESQRRLGREILGLSSLEDAERRRDPATSLDGGAVDADLKETPRTTAEAHARKPGTPPGFRKKPGPVKIYGEDNRVRTEHTYGKDANPPKG
jgi:hypothetical protein